ncbi:MAG TPA: prolyl oligopeptidase family serine peptidase, partial [Thermomicrobiaceae bacterium]|nr:prolyl oligopeptidase family serine peptidase [Thermomicrobiaceae bacterium]
FAWVDDERLHFTRMAVNHQMRTHHLVDLTGGEERELVREESHRGLKAELPPVVAPGGQSVVYVLTPENWPHLFHYDLTSGQLRQLTSGDCDDTGHAGDSLSFSPDGRRLVYCSNRDTDLNQRRLWLVELSSASSRLLTPGPGTDSCAAWSSDGSRIAYLHCSPDQSADIWLAAPDSGEARQVSHSMPATLGPERLTAPQHLTYPSRDGLAVQADLFLPKGFDPERRYPAVVWVHGGMARQMRYGWHPMHTYALFYSFQQYLLHRGFVILSVDYRGSIGYGRDYEEGTYLQMLQGDLADVVAGAAYLRTLPYIDPEGIGVYGLSYGGYLTLGALTKHPDAFALGINLAGIWDWPQYEAWREAKYPGSNWQGRARLGGAPTEANADAWYQASPKHFVAGLRVPLLNLMGTADERVDFAQLDAIIRDCVAHQKDFAALYYPGETHTFTHRRTWRDAFPRIERAFQRYLTVPQEERPPAMI